MLNVFFTVDVEIWCSGWDNIDQKFPQAFDRYIYGKTSRGSYGLPFQTQLLKSHGLTGVFFVEPLFSTRFGQEPLSVIVNILNNANQEIQLHLHTEWVDEAIVPILPKVTSKRQHMRFFSLEEQIILIQKGLELLHETGAAPMSAFRAGSFGFNRDTLKALAANGISFDSSYNATLFGLDSGVSPGAPVYAPILCDGVIEYPMTVFKDGLGKFRHAQLTACSFSELEKLLWQTCQSGAKSIVLLSHSFELLNQSKSRPDWIAIRRFEKLCKFFDRHRDYFMLRGFHDLSPEIVSRQPEPQSMPRWRTVIRLLEQAYRRIYQ